MNREKILSILKSKESEEGVFVTTDLGDKWVSRFNNSWHFKTALGFLDYTSEDLAQEMSEWDEEIISIE